MAGKASWRRQTEQSLKLRRSVLALGSGRGGCSGLGRNQIHLLWAPFLGSNPWSAGITELLPCTTRSWELGENARQLTHGACPQEASCVDGKTKLLSEEKGCPEESQQV